MAATNKVLSAIFIFVTWLGFVPGLVSAAPMLQLSHSAEQISIGNSASSTINLDAQGNELVGTDVILTFDPAVVEITALAKGPLFPVYPVASYDNVEGTLKLSGSSNYNQYFQGTGMLATITFRGLTAGDAGLEIKWTPGATNDTNVVSPQAQDLLLDAPVVNTLVVTADQVSAPEPKLNMPTDDSISDDPAEVKDSKPGSTVLAQAKKSTPQETNLPGSIAQLLPKSKLVRPLVSTPTPEIAGTQAINSSNAGISLPVSLLVFVGLFVIALFMRVFLFR